MIQREITYRDLDGNVLTEMFYFHYSTAEATELKVVLGDDIQKRIQALIDSKNPKEIVKIFKGIIADSIGKRSENGKSFLKTDAYREEFLGSDAYSEMLLWLLKDTANMSAFVNGIFPANMNERIGQLVAEREAAGKTTVELPDLLPQLKPNLSVVPSVSPSFTYYTPGKKFSEYTREELTQLTQDEWNELLNADK